MRDELKQSLTIASEVVEKLRKELAVYEKKRDAIADAHDGVCDLCTVLEEMKP